MRVLAVDRGGLPGGKQVCGRVVRQATPLLLIAASRICPSQASTNRPNTHRNNQQTNSQPTAISQHNQQNQWPSPNPSSNPSTHCRHTSGWFAITNTELSDSSMESRSSSSEKQSAPPSTQPMLLNRTDAERPLPGRPI